MKIINPKTVLWAIGVLQPVSAKELQSYFKRVLIDAGRMPDIKEFRHFCLAASDSGQLVRINGRPDLFALTLRGNRYLSNSQRKSRDRLRIFLLRDARKGRLRTSREADTMGLGGDAPSEDRRLTLQGEASKPGLARGRACWPRVIQQLNTGPSPASRDNFFPPLLSFTSLEQLAIASDISEDSLIWDYTNLGLILGISPKLIQQITRHPQYYYRSFNLSKRSGGTREIQSPRVFLKVIQQFLVDYILTILPVSDAVFSYRTGLSIQDNAMQHLRANYVANIDIQNFFGSVKIGDVKRLLIHNNLPEASAALIARLATINGVLPQGAPTSPIISNAFLLSFDNFMLNECRSLRLSYSRYADDITISGDNRKTIANIIMKAENQLAIYNLYLNRKKTRIASRHGQQKVTGIVVNDKALPPRIFRRQIRAAFHNTHKNKNIDWKRIHRLYGYLSYLSSFDELRNTTELDVYRKILLTLKSKIK